MDSLMFLTKPFKMMSGRLDYLSSIQDEPKSQKQSRPSTKTQQRAISKEKTQFRFQQRQTNRTSKDDSHADEEFELINGSSIVLLQKPSDWANLKQYDSASIRISVLTNQLPYQAYKLYSKVRRREIWVSTYRRLSNNLPQLRYQQICQRPNHYTEAIQNRLKSAQVDNEYFKEQATQSSLKNILQAYSTFDPQLGFKEEMIPIVGNLICCYDPNQNDEMMQDIEFVNNDQGEEVFYLFVEVMITREWSKYFLDGFPGLIQAIYIIETQVKNLMPDLHKHLIQCQLFGRQDIPLVFQRFYLGLLMNNSPKQFNEMVLTLVLFEGEQAIHRLVLGMFRYFKKDLLAMKDYGTLHHFLMHGMTTQFLAMLNSKDAMTHLKNIGMASNQPIQCKVAPLPAPQRVTLLNQIINKF